MRYTSPEGFYIEPKALTSGDCGRKEVKPELLTFQLRWGPMIWERNMDSFHGRTSTEAR